VRQAFQITDGLRDPEGDHHGHRLPRFGNFFPFQFSQDTIYRPSRGLPRAKSHLR
jgi:hypothetical protein